MKNIAYYNGEIAPIEELRVPITDRGCYFGDGVYDATCVINGVPMAFQDHIDRIYRSAKMIRIDIPMPKKEMKAILLDLISRVEPGELMLYWQITRGAGKRSHAFGNLKSGPSLWAMLQPIKMRDVYTAWDCVTTEDKRYYYCNIKTINLLPSVLAAQHAEDNGAAETIFHRGERVTECAHSNIHIIRNGVLLTAPLDELILPGITRAHILNICGQLGIPVREEPFTLDELFAADEVFFSSSSALTCRVKLVDGRPVGMRDEKTFAAIRDAYQEELRKECHVL